MVFIIFLRAVYLFFSIKRPAHSSSTRAKLSGMAGGLTGVCSAEFWVGKSWTAREVCAVLRDSQAEQRRRRTEASNRLAYVSAIR